MKAYNAFTMMIEMGDSIREDIPAEMREELSDIVEELVAMRNRYSQMLSIETILPSNEELDFQ